MGTKKSDFVQVLKKNRTFAAQKRCTTTEVDTS